MVFDERGNNRLFLDYGLYNNNRTAFDRMQAENDKIRAKSLLTGDRRKRVSTLAKMTVPELKAHVESVAQDEKGRQLFEPVRVAAVHLAHVGGDLLDRFQHLQLQGDEEKVAALELRLHKVMRSLDPTSWEDHDVSHFREKAKKFQELAKQRREWALAKPIHLDAAEALDKISTMYDAHVRLMKQAGFKTRTIPPEVKAQRDRLKEEQEANEQRMQELRQTHETAVAELKAAHAEQIGRFKAALTSMHGDVEGVHDSLKGSALLPPVKKAREKLEGVSARLQAHLLRLK